MGAYCGKVAFFVSGTFMHSLIQNPIKISLYEKKNLIKISRVSVCRCGCMCMCGCVCVWVCVCVCCAGVCVSTGVCVCGYVCVCVFVCKLLRHLEIASRIFFNIVFGAAQTLMSCVLPNDVCKSFVLYIGFFFQRRNMNNFFPYSPVLLYETQRF